MATCPNVEVNPIVEVVEFVRLEASNDSGR